jgi:DNA-directed RNA polymerase specialized sigma24 family protein
MPLSGSLATRGLNNSGDAEDVTQAVLLKLVVKMRDFHYDPAQSFRARLRTATGHVLSDFLAEGRREQDPQGPERGPYGAHRVRGGPQQPHSSSG